LYHDASAEQRKELTMFYRVLTDSSAVDTKLFDSVWALIAGPNFVYSVAKYQTRFTQKIK
jgi:hypothetical protein